MQIIHIKEPYYSAGKTYGWGKEIFGIGIKTEIVDKAKKEKKNLYIKIGHEKDVWKITPKMVERLAKKYNSVKEVRFGAKLYVIPMNSLEKLPNFDDKYNKSYINKDGQEVYII